MADQPQQGRAPAGKKPLVALLSKRSQMSKIFTKKDEIDKESSEESITPLSASRPSANIQSTTKTASSGPGSINFDWTEYDRRLESNRKKLTATRSLRSTKKQGREDESSLNRSHDDLPGVPTPYSQSLSARSLTTEPRSFDDSEFVKPPKKDSAPSSPRSPKISKNLVEESPQTNVDLMKDFDWKGLGLSVLTMPNDEFEVNEVKNTLLKTIENPSDFTPKLPPPEFVNEIVKLYTKDHRVVKHKYEMFGNKSKSLGFLVARDENRSGTSEKTDIRSHPLKFVPIKDSDNTQQASSDSQAGDPVPETKISLESSNNQYEPKNMRGYREDIFKVYSLSEKELNPGVIRKAELYTDRSNIECYILLENFKFESSLVNEIMYFNFSLHNVKKEQKISEDFHVTYNPSIRLSLSVDGKSKPLFPISTPDLQDVYVIVKVYKQAITSDHKESFRSPIKVKSKRDSDTRIDDARNESDCIPFIWGAFSLFNEEAALLGSVANPLKEIKERSKLLVKGGSELDLLESGYQSRFFQCEMKLVKPGTSITDEEIYECVTKEDSRRHKPFAAKCQVEVKKIPSDFKGRRADASGLQLKSKYPQSAISTLFFELQELSDSSHGLDISSGYTNNLYIYPQGVSLKFTDALQIRVQLRKNDHSQPEPNIYGKLRREYNDSAYTILYYSKNPHMNDEIKIMLPLDMTVDYHLFFTFYDVCLKKNGKSITKIGDSFLPLYKDRRVVDDGVHVIPISKGALPETGYGSDPKWSKSKKFTFRTKLCSTVLTQDTYLAFYLQNFDKDQVVMEAISNLIKADLGEVIRLLPLVFNTLIRVICKAEEDPARYAFNALIIILKRFDSHVDDMLNTYATYVFDNTKGAPAFDKLSKYWLEIDDTLLTDFKHYWFLFAIITRSMVLFLHDKHKLQSKKKSSYFSDIFKATLQHLLHKLLNVSENQFEYDVAISFPLFLVSLFGLLEAGLVFKMIYHSVSNLSMIDMTRAFIKFTWLKIICDYQNYVPLSLPLDMEILSVEAADLQAKFWERHFLAGLLLQELQSCLRSNVLPTIREQGVIVLRNLLRKHELDVRYQHKEVRRTITGIYLPYLAIIAEKIDVLRSMGMHEPELTKWMICFLWILKNTKARTLRSFWTKNAQKSIENFLVSLSLCVDAFIDRGNSIEPNMIILDTIMTFISHFHELLEKEDHPFTQHIFGIIAQLLNSQSETFICTAYFALSEVIPLLKKTLFVFKTTKYCGELTLKILKHCNVSNYCVRSRASLVFYLLMRANFQERGSLSRVSAQSIVSVSKLVGTDMKTAYNTLHSSLASVVDNLKQDTKYQEDPQFPAFSKELTEVINRLVEISKQNKRIAQNWIDEELTADIYVQIANESANSPDLRLTWLENLALFHSENGNIEEAAQCKIHIAYLILQYIQFTNPKQLPKELRDLKSELFLRISPSIFNEIELMRELRDEEEALFQSDLWNLPGMIKVLNESVKFLDRARKYELCIEIMHLLALIFKHDKDYASMKAWAKHYESICEGLLSVTKEGKEVFSRYYRVTFFGKNWLKDKDGQIYIYKKKYKYPIGDIAAALKRTLKHKFHVPEDDILSLPNKEIDQSTLDPNKFYFQIVSVQPYFGGGADTEDRNTPFEQNFNLVKFISEIPFNKDGGKIDEDDPSKLCKRKTIFTIERAFPYITNRVPVSHTQDIILSPIECAVESLQARVNQFRTEVYTANVRKNNLQALLTGTLATTVHVGPMKFCQVFLDGGADYPVDNQNQIRYAMAEMLLLCEQGMKLNRAIIGPEQLPFQNMLEKKYEEIMKLFKEKYGGSLEWSNITRDVEEKGKQARQQVQNSERKLKEESHPASSRASLTNAYNTSFSSSFHGLP